MKSVKRIISLLLCAGMVFCTSSCGGSEEASKAEESSVYEKSVTEESSEEAATEYINFTSEELTDKIKGGWAGQMLGVSWGISTEFQYAGQYMPESAVPDLSKIDINHGFVEDDLYVELTYLEEMRKRGYDTSVEKLALAFASSSYSLDHANKYGRENVRNGIMPPLSGSPEYNIHCDDIDWQINADFVGGVFAYDVNQSASKSFEIGHITNYGDGVYGGVYVSAMHSAAFYASTVREIVETGLSAIPENTLFYKVQADVLNCYDSGKSWEQCWQEIQDKWGSLDRCVWYAEKYQNIDAKLNSAYVTMGLLYGEEDFENSMKIAMRCGQDSDCNPSTVGGILGNFYGFEKLSSYFENLDTKNTVFYTTTMNFELAVNTSVKLAKDYYNDKGYVTESGYAVPKSAVTPVPYEQWEDMPSAELNVSENDGVVTIAFTASDNSGIKSMRFDMGDGNVFPSPIPTYTYAKAGTYKISISVTSNNGVSRTFEKEITVSRGVEKAEYEGYGNLASLGYIICTVTSPAGSGSKDLNVIRDGKKSGGNTSQYDTFAYNPNVHEEYVGYIFGSEYVFDKVVFTEGMHFDNGGWFADGSLNLQGLKDGEWVDLVYSMSPEYPTGDTQSAFGRNFETYTFEISSPEPLSGIRIIGFAGGSTHFIGIAELEVYGSEQ